MIRAALCTLAVALAPLAVSGGAVAGDRGEALDAARAHELIVLLRQDCGSCHGMRLTGGLGPPLTPEALQAKPAASLAATILDGRPGTAMPPWRRFVSEREVHWLVQRMREGDLDATR